MTTTTFAAATEPQLHFIDCLKEERQLSPYAASHLQERLDEGITKVEASTIITWLKQQPLLPKEVLAPPSTTERLPDVPAGRYAVETNGDGHLAFYRVDRPSEGRWAGYVFVKVQASDELHNIRGFAQRDTILRKIAVDPAGAARRYGLEIGSCGICGRTLTDETSRAYGLGPVCREKTGW
jgi:hypothetical protein